MKALSIIVVLIIIPTFLFAQKPKQKSLICTFILTPIATLVAGSRQLISTARKAEFINVSAYRNTIYKKQFPTRTWLEVKGLALPGQLIEIDMEAHKSK